MTRNLMLALSLLFATTAAAASPPSKAPAKSVEATIDSSLLPKTAASACALPPKTSHFTFWLSCSNVAMNGCTLEADCRQSNNQPRKATFDMSKFPQCYSDFFGGRNLVNYNGTLCCGYAGTKVICGT